MKESTKAEIVMNAVTCNVPHRYIREMVTGKSEVPEQKQEIKDTEPVPALRKA